MPACFWVRAQVDASVKDAFDRWYQEEHLPDARVTFKATRAWRGWSALEPNVHHACYEFENLAAAQAIVGSDGLKRLVADFDRTWGAKVTRSRDFIDITQAI